MLAFQRCKSTLVFKRLRRALLPVQAMRELYTQKCSSSPHSQSKVFTRTQLLEKYRASKPITALTAYDYPSAKQVDNAGIDVILVGDSAAMVVHGHATTLPMTLDQLITHSQAVRRGVQRAMIVGDLPFGSYEDSIESAIRSAVRLTKEGSVDAIKLEGASETRLQAVQSIVAAGIPVMGHIGLTPQAVNVIGGFKPQGRTATAAFALVEDAIGLERAGCFAIVIECVPEVVARAITAAVGIPTIGIGAGPYTSGQILVYHDVLGLTEHPHHAAVAPRFCKQYATLGLQVKSALERFRQEVECETFPRNQYCPYTMSEDELNEFTDRLCDGGFERVVTSLRSRK